MRSFLGIVGYYRDHMPAFAENSATLSDLLMIGKSKQVQLNEAQEHAYSLLKEYLLQECLAVVWGIRCFKLYLAGKSFSPKTDDKPLKYLKDASYQNDRVFHWAMAVQEYSLRVEDIPCKENIGADFWSGTGYSC